MARLGSRHRRGQLASNARRWPIFVMRNTRPNWIIPKRPICPIVGSVPSCISSTESRYGSVQEATLDYTLHHTTPRSAPDSVLLSYLSNLGKYLRSTPVEHPRRRISIHFSIDQETGTLRVRQKEGPVGRRKPHRRIWPQRYNTEDGEHMGWSGALSNFRRWGEE